MFVLKIRSKKVRPDWVNRLQHDLRQTRQALEKTQTQLAQQSQWIEVVTEEKQPKSPLARAFKGLLTLTGLAGAITTGLVVAQNLKNQLELQNSDLAAAPDLNLQKFSGRWYEIARYQQSPSKKVGVTVDYLLQDPETLLETCHYYLEDFSGQQYVQQNALKVNKDNPALMQKQILGPFKNNYWVLETGVNYEYAVIASPSRNRLYILSRQPFMNPVHYEALLHRLQTLGFDTQKLYLVPHQPRAGFDNRFEQERQASSRSSDQQVQTRVPLVEEEAQADEALNVQDVELSPYDDRQQRGYQQDALEQLKMQDL